MGHKYYMPENHENLSVCEGFYIGNKVFFGAGEPSEEQWNSSMAELVMKVKRFLPEFRIINEWESGMGIRRYVLMRNDLMEIIMGEDEEYASIFLIIPETCQSEAKAKCEFEKTFKILKSFLMHKYPEQVYRRKNTWNLELLTATTSSNRRSAV